MAVEVKAGIYLNVPYIDQPRVFISNPLHDIESVWWVGVWFLLCHYQPSNLLDIDVQEHIKVVKNFGQTLFNSPIDPLSRRYALTSQDLLANVEPQFFPHAVQHLIILLEEFRVQLVTYYESYKPMASQDRSFFIPDLHRKFGDVVEETLKELENDKTEFWLFQHISQYSVY